MKEASIEDYLAKRVKALGGEVRKVQWVGRRSAPDRLVMLPWTYDRWGGIVNNTFWVELKSPTTVRTFPANPHERAQAREHHRMGAFGQEVHVLGTFEQVDEALRKVLEALL